MRRFFESFTYAFKGLFLLFRHETNARVHLFFAIATVTSGFYFSISSSEWFAVIICIGMVLAAEAFNTAIEKIADYIQPEKDPRIGLIKDLAAGAVLFTAISALIVGLMIFLPQFLSIITG